MLRYFFTRVDGRLLATPRPMALLPAELNRRALRAVLAGMMEKFHFSKVGLSSVLVFVGLKMTLVDVAKVPPAGAHPGPGASGAERRVVSPVRTASGALQALKDGNARFVAHVRSAETLARQLLRAELALGQQPFAVVLGCSDSRVPAELVFDQGLGDLFVIRVAGNVVAPSQIGSVEFAVEHFGTPLVVVLGHTLCGAVDATVNALLGNAAPASQNLNSIVNRIRPALEGWVAPGGGEARADLMRRAVRANVRASADHLRHGSEIIESRVLAGQLSIVGAEYDLETGQVDFFEGLPATPAR